MIASPLSRPAPTPPADDPETDPWAALGAELDAWSAEGREALFWWRDDDAAAPGPQLDRLLALSTETGAPVALASVPARLHPAFPATVRACPTALVVQHGYAHVNHAAGEPGGGAWELGLHRPIDVVLAELAEGRAVLKRALGDDRFAPILSPPWNKIDAALIPHLARIGFRALSCVGLREAAQLAPGLQALNAHCNPIKWRGGPHFIGAKKAIAQIVGCLAARRSGAADPDEATGFLTHHIDHDEAIWAFCAQVLDVLAAHPAVRFVSARELLAP